MHTAEVQRAFDALQREINDRTEDTDTLAVSIPADKIKNLDSLPLPVTEREDNTLCFDWFTVPENGTGFSDVAARFVSALVKCGLQS